MNALRAFCCGSLSLAAGDPAFLDAHAAWQQARLAALIREDGWLSVVGLHWLKPGENMVGGAPGLAVSLSAPGLPDRAGVLVVADGSVRLRTVPGSPLTVDGVVPDGECALRADVDGQPQLLRLGRLSFFIIRRGDRFGVRVKDPESEGRRAFKGIPAYEPDPAFRVVATFDPYPRPRKVQVPTVIGTTETHLAPGRVRFRLQGRICVLEPVIEDPAHPELFFVFKDATNATDTYPAGRFLTVPMPKDGKVVLDFNRATNPPCAFTDFATCPRTRPENVLPVAVRAGEKTVEHP